MDGSTRAPPIPAGNLRTRVDGAAVNRLSAEKTTRLFEGLRGEFFIYPIERSTYRVVSLKDDGTYTTYTISVFDRPICECMDYIFQCIGTDRWCKHIFRVWAEVHVGELPPLGIEPAKWLQSKLETALFARIDDPDTDDTDRARELRDAYEALEDNPSSGDFWVATSRWRQHRVVEPTP